MNTIHIIYRNNHIYKGLSDFLDKIFYKIPDNNYQIIVYGNNLNENITNYKHDLSHKWYKIIWDNLIGNKNFEDRLLGKEIRYINGFESVKKIKESIFNKYVNSNKKIYILDSCINYNSILDKMFIINNNIEYVLINTHGVHIPYLSGYCFKSNSLNIFEFTNFTYKVNSHVFDEDIIVDNTNFIHLYNIPKFDLDNLFINFISNNVIDYANYNLNDDDSYILNICRILDQNVQDVIDILINNNLKKYKNDFSFIWCLHKSNKIHEILRLINKKPENSIIFINNRNKNTLINCLLNNRMNDIYELPNWIIDITLSEFDIANFYFDEITIGNQLNIQIQSQILQIDKFKYVGNNYNIELKDSVININNKHNIRQSNIALLEKNKDVLILTSLTPLIVWEKIDDKNNLYEYLRFDNNICKYKDILFFGSLVLFYNYYLLLIKYKNTYNFAIFDNSTLNLINLSKRFNIDNDNEVIGLHSYNNKIYFLFNNNKIVEIYEKKLILEILNINITFNPNIFLQIKDKNNFILEFDNISMLDTYTQKSLKNLSNEFKNFTFNLDSDNPIAVVKENVQNKILSYDSTYYFINRFIYYPLDPLIENKKYDIFFYEPNHITDELYRTCVNLGYTIGDNFKLCKYVVIYQEIFEKLSSVQVSEFINNNCLIISLIDDFKINNNSFIKNFTSSNYLNKLFLFNIAMNDDYIQFILDKILSDNNYEARLEYMEIDKQKMYIECSIYNSILNLKKYEKQILDLNDSQTKIVKNIINKYDCLAYNSVIQKIVLSDFEANISIYDNNIPDFISKINFLGDITIVSENDRINSDIFLIPNISLLNNFNIVNDSIIIFLLDEKKNVTCFSELESEINV